MNEIYLYFLKSTFSLSLLYMTYWFFLRKDTFFTITRYYLIFSLVFSFLAPLLPINLNFSTEDINYIIKLESITIDSNSINLSATERFSLFQIILTAYLTGAGIFFTRFIIQLFQILYLIIKNGIRKHAGFSVVYLDTHYSPFSFFYIIFINKRNGKKEIEEVITHERIHAIQLHSIDLILLELATIFQWFNPFIWLYRHAIKSNHEFLADEGVLLSGIKKTKYQQILLSITTGIQVSELSNNFNKSILKRRFIMMTKTKSGNRILLKYLLIIPVALLLVLSFACSSENDKDLTAVQETKQTSIDTKQNQDNSNELVKVEEKKDEAFSVVEKLPAFKDGEKALFAYLGKNIKYPETAREDGISGRVFVQFIVEKDGSISNVHIKRGVREDLDNEAVRVVKSMPDWTPGENNSKVVRVTYNLPINYKLN